MKRVALLFAATLLAQGQSADAFCGFYVGGAGSQMFNNATQVVLMRHGSTTVLSMQNNYQGPPENFAMVIPVPVVIQEDQVKTLPNDLFGKVDTLGAPRLVEYWEQDPCRPQYEYDDLYPSAALADESVEKSSGPADDYQVKIEAQFTVAEYDIVVLSAKDSTGLERWLTDNKYAIPSGSAPLLRPYIESGTKFFVAKVDPKKVTFKDGMATLSPLRFHYDSPEFNLPIRLGLANSGGKQDLIVNILAPGTRYEVANYPNALIPTNIVVKDGVRTRFGEFYAALFDQTLEQVPGAVVTEYAWDSRTCDPCPGPTLDDNDLATLGADVIGQRYQDALYSGMVLTRLHARYGKEVGDDLVFRSVDGVVGGTGIPDPKGVISREPSRGGMNMFQGRYIILHPWLAAVSCESPQRGQWGGPPDAQLATPMAATNTAFAPRGNFELASAVAGDNPLAEALQSEGKSLPTPNRKAHSCGCQSQGGVASGVLALFTAALIGRGRRRRRK